MKIYTSTEQAQLLLAILRSAGENATLLSVARDRNEAIIVTATLPESVEDRVKNMATTIEG